MWCMEKKPYHNSAFLLLLFTFILKNVKDTGFKVKIFKIYNAMLPCPTMSLSYCFEGLQNIWDKNSLFLAQDKLYKSKLWITSPIHTAGISIIGSLVHETSKCSSIHYNQTKKSQAEWRRRGLVPTEKLIPLSSILSLTKCC